MFSLFACFVAHGTYIGHIRLESKKPQQVPIDSEIHFGASTRIYMIRERPQPVSNLGGSEEMEKRNDDIEGGLLGLPESETELDVSKHLIFVIISIQTVILGIIIILISNLSNHITGY